MNITIIVPSFYPAVQFGGPIYSLKDFVEEAAVQDITSKIYTTDIGIKGKVPTNQSILFNGNPKIEITYFTGASLFKKYLSIPLIIKLPKIIYESSIIKMEDLFSIYVPITFMIGCLLSKKVICSPRGVLSKQALNKNWFLKIVYIYLIIMPLSKKIVWHATSELEKKQILEIFGNKNIHIIPNGIRQKKFKKNKSLNDDSIILKAQNIFNRSTKKVIGLGRYDPHKQFEILIEAFRHLNPSDYELILAGPEMKENLESFYLQSSDKMKNVHFFKNLDENQKWFFLEQSDVLVLPSKSENFGNVIIESLSSGTPVITSDQTPWTMIDNENIGKCLKIISPINLANAIKEITFNKIIYSESLCKNFSANFRLSNTVTLFKNTFGNSH